MDVQLPILNGKEAMIEIKKDFSKKELALTVHMLIWATYGNLPSWLLKYPSYLSIKKKIRQHMLGLIERIRADPERASSTLAGRYLDLEPPLGRDRWDNGELVVPVDLVPRHPVRKVFTRAVHKKSITAIGSFWQRIIFSGRGSPPTEKASEANRELLK